MHVQRVHYGKLGLLLLSSSCLVFLLHTVSHSSSNTIDVEVEGLEEVEVEREEEARSGEEALGVAQLHSCPVCLGRGLCQEVSQGWLTVSVFGRPVPGGIEYKGTLQAEESHLAVFQPLASIWETWDAAVCANSSQPRGCLVSEAAPSSFLFRNRGLDGPGLRKLHKMTSQASPSALTACSSRDLARKLGEVFDENRDGRLTAEERAVLVTTVGVAPGLAALKLAGGLAVRGLPGYIGACGRLVVTEGGLTPLASYRQADWATRRDLASQVLSLLEGLLPHESGWMWIVWDLDMDSFSVTRTGQVVLSSLASVTPVARAILQPPKGERPVCNEECFTAWREEVMMLTPRGQPGKGCSSAGQRADMAYSLACSQVLGGPAGLLAPSAGGPGAEVGAEDKAGEGGHLGELLSQCARESQPGGRWKAVDELMDYLEEADDGSGDLENSQYEEEEEDEEEDNTEENNEDYGKTRRKWRDKDSKEEEEEESEESQDGMSQGEHEEDDDLEDMEE